MLLDYLEIEEMNSAQFTYHLILARCQVKSGLDMILGCGVSRSQDKGKEEKKL